MVYLFFVFRREVSLVLLLVTNLYQTSHYTHNMHSLRGYKLSELILASCIKNH